MPDPFDAILDEILTPTRNPTQDAIGRGTPRPGLSGPQQSNATLALLQRLKGPFVHVGALPVKQSGDSLASILDESAGQYPTYRYEFADGTYVDIGGPQYSVLGGTALAALAPAKEASPIFKEDPSGNMQRWDPNADGGRGSFVPAPGMPKVEAKPETPKPWQDPMTGRTIDLNTGKELSPGLPGWTPGLGLRWPTQATPRQPRWPEEIEKDILTNRKLAAEMERYPEETAYDRAQDVLKQRNAELDRQARETANAVSLFGQVSSAQQAAVPYAMLPGQEYFLLAEPGGLNEQISKRLGIAYDPKMYRPQPVELNWDEIWRGSQARARGQ